MFEVIRIHSQNNWVLRVLHYSSFRLCHLWFSGKQFQWAAKECLASYYFPHFGNSWRGHCNSCWFALRFFGDFHGGLGEEVPLLCCIALFITCFISLILSLSMNREDLVDCFCFMDQTNSGAREGSKDLVKVHFGLK